MIDEKTLETDPFCVTKAMTLELRWLAHNFECEHAGNVGDYQVNSARGNITTLLAHMNDVEELEAHYYSARETIAKLEAEIALLKVCGMAAAE